MIQRPQRNLFVGIALIILAVILCLQFEDYLIFEDQAWCGAVEFPDPYERCGWDSQPCGPEPVCIAKKEPER